MKKFLILLIVLSTSTCFGQNAMLLKVNTASKSFTIERKQTHNFELLLLKDTFYSISVEQFGIDVELLLKDASGNVITKKDNPTGKIGTEKITFSPHISGRYAIIVRALDETENAEQGNYTVAASTIPKNLKKFSLPQLYRDFDILKDAYRETRVGLWHNTYIQFDSLCNLQRGKLRNQMTALDFYQITAPLTAYTKEGHSSIAVAEEISDYFKQYGRYFPFFVKIIDRKIYVINDTKNANLKGRMITKINGVDADSIIKVFENIEPADGFNLTSKHLWIENSFAKYYIRYFGSPDSYRIDLMDYETGKRGVQEIPSIKYQQYLDFRNDFLNHNPNYSFTKPAELAIDTLLGLAKLTINDFGSGNYKGKKGFKQLLDEHFTSIKKNKVQHLVIDIRKNEGGSQGMEDILLSYLTDSSYKKYKYVEIPSFDYSFLDYTDYKGQADVLKKELSSEFYRGADGRYLEKPLKYKGLPPDSLHFSGKIYVLTSGLTFSGGSEFAALAKNHTSAVFIGEETGGGYYGNTSGIFLNFTLPETRTAGRIPLIKYSLETSINTIPFGRGLIPDHIIYPDIADYLNNRDAELEYVKSLILGQPK